MTRRAPRALFNPTEALAPEMLAAHVSTWHERNLGTTAATFSQGLQANLLRAVAAWFREGFDSPRSAPIIPARDPKQCVCVCVCGGTRGVAAESLEI